VISKVIEVLASKKVDIPNKLSSGRQWATGEFMLAYRLLISSVSPLDTCRSEGDLLEVLRGLGYPYTLNEYLFKGTTAPPLAVLYSILDWLSVVAEAASAPQFAEEVEYMLDSYELFMKEEDLQPFREAYLELTSVQAQAASYDLTHLVTATADLTAQLDAEPELARELETFIGRAEELNEDLTRATDMLSQAELTKSTDEGKLHTEVSWLYRLLCSAGQVDRLTPGLDCRLEDKLREAESLEGQVTRLEHQLDELVVAVQGEEYCALAQLVKTLETELATCEADNGQLEERVGHIEVQVAAGKSEPDQLSELKGIVDQDTKRLAAHLCLITKP
jgi:hypothetical protein